jgi:hypothetical protein
VSLFNRSLRSLTLTPEGEAFYPAARQAIAAADEAEALSFASLRVRDVLRIRSVPTFAIHCLEPLVPAFRGFCQRSRQRRRHTLPGGVSLPCLEKGEHSGCTAEMENAAAVGGDLLVVAGAETEGCAEFVTPSTDEAAVILLEPVIPAGARPVLHVSAQRRMDGAWIGAVPVRRDAIGGHAGGRLGGAEERLRGIHVPVLGEHGVDQAAVAVDGAKVQWSGRE